MLLEWSPSVVCHGAPLLLRFGEGGIHFVRDSKRIPRLEQSKRSSVINPANYTLGRARCDQNSNSLLRGWVVPTEYRTITRVELVINFCSNNIETPLFGTSTNTRSHLLLCHFTIWLFQAFYSLKFLEELSDNNYSSLPTSYGTSTSRQIRYRNDDTCSVQLIYDTDSFAVTENDI